MPNPRPRRSPTKLILRAARWALAAYLGVHILAASAFLGLRFIDPPTTGLQMQRRVESWFNGKQYRKRQTFVPLSRISRHLQHAAIAAEDGQFYHHWGIEWNQLSIALEEAKATGEPPRGASTISQQLIKNLFFTTHRNPARKALEYTLAPLSIAILGRQRILELYLNVVEWGPGVWGAEAGARYHYGIVASRLSRDQASRLAACLPSPRRRRPQAMNSYSAIIQTRMSQLGW